MRISRKGYKKYIDKSPVWARRRADVLRSRGNCCEICKSISGKPQIHHLHYGNLGQEQRQDLQVLCDECHRAEHRARPVWSFEDQKSLTRYIDTLEPVEASRRFPAFWIETEKYIQPAKKTAKPPVKNPIVSPDGLSYMPRPRPKTDSSRFSILAAAGFKCQDCCKPIRPDCFHVIENRAVCGCKMAHAFMANKTIASK